MSVTLRAMNRNGTVLTGVGIRNPVTLTVNAGVPLTKLVSDLFGSIEMNPIWLRIEPEAPGLRVYYAIGDRNMSALDGSIPIKPATDFFAFHRSSSLYVTNLSGQSATVTVTEIASGRTITTTVPGARSTALWVPSTARIHSSEPLFAMEGTGDEHRFLLSAPEPLSAAGSNLVFPHAVVGAGYSTTLTLVNVDSIPMDATIRFGLNSSTVKIGGDSAASFTLADHFSISSTAVLADAVRVSVASGQGRLLGKLTIENETSSTDVASPTQATDIYFPHVLHGNGFFTGLAIATGAASAAVTVELYTASGSVAGSAVVNLEPNQHLSRLISELIPAITAQSGGYVRIKSTHPISAWQIFGSAHAMTSVPPM
jgi:hypothetical protein